MFNLNDKETKGKPGALMAIISLNNHEKVLKEGLGKQTHHIEFTKICSI